MPTKKDYYREAIDLCKSGKEFFLVLQELRRRELLSYKQRGVKKVEILTAGADNSCAACLQLNQKVIDIDEALKNMPLPVKMCSMDVFGVDRGFCRCTYAPVVL